jgi:hypothetical protein
MNRIIAFILFLTTCHLPAQNKRAEDYGFRHFQTIFQGDTVDILIKSKKGEEQQPKPLFFFCQGSKPIPLIITDGEKKFSTFPFNPDILCTDYHLAIVSKPGIPVIIDYKNLNSDFSYREPSTGRAPKKYSDRNYLDYYTGRNLSVIGFLQKQSFISKNKLIVAGHSEGSTIASKIASISEKVTHLNYSGGSPMGRIMNMLSEDRENETDTDSTKFSDEEFKFWESVVDNKENMDDSYGDTFKATYDFSIPPIRYLEKVKIPVLVSYGSKDRSAPFNDYLRIETIRRKRKNFTYNS